MRQELGYKEKSGQLTKFGQWYADRVQDTQYRNGPWCDMFIAWAADKSELSQFVGEFAWTPSHAAWFMKQGAWTQKPEPGALVFFDWKGGKSYKGIDHVGIVEKVSGKKIHTIEANVDRIWLKRKTRETDKVVGYGIPRLVKANADKLGEIRSTERPFVPAPRVETGQGSPLDVLGTPPALLTAMVLMTVVLSLRITGRRRGTHRRLSWPWNAPTTPPRDASEVQEAPRREKGAARNRVSARDKPPVGDRAHSRDGAPARERVTARAKASPSENAQTKPHAAPAPTGRAARTRVSAAATSGRPTSTRRKPYETG